MAQHFFPPLTDQLLVPFRAIVVQAKADPAYLQDAECPYTPQQIEFLQTLIGAGSAGVEEQIPMDNESIEDQLGKIYTSLINLQKGDARLDPKDKVQVWKASVGLLERIAALRERFFSVKEHQNFQKLVIEFLDETMTADQRTKFTQKLGQYLDLR
jgi:hypothetical protein